MAKIADPAIDDFVRNPLGFLRPVSDKNGLRWNAVSSFGIFTNDQAKLGVTPDQGYFKLVKQYANETDRTLAIKYHGPERDPYTDSHVVWAYHLGYNGGGQLSHRPAFVDVPKTVQENTLLFTGTLSGCSVIVTELDKDHYRIFHDSRAESSLHYDNVVMAIDHSDYALSGEGMASVFMQYREGQWTMFAQLQTLKQVNGEIIAVPRPTESQSSHEIAYYDSISLVPGSYNAIDAQDKFNDRREANREELKRLALEALIDTKIPDSPDGAFHSFEGKEISLSNPGVSHSQDIRKVIKEARDRFVPVKRELPLVEDVLKLGGAAFKGLVTTTIPPTISCLREVGMTGSIRKAMGDSETFDYVYLWLKQKEARGLDAVVVMDGRREVPFGSTAGEIFTEQQIDALRTSNPEFAAGFEKYESVRIPGYKEDMAPLELMKMFNDPSKDLKQREMGALLRRIKITRDRKLRESVWDRTNDIVDMFQRNMGSTKPMPQDILLNAIPDEYGGRCYPLVRAMAVALAQSDFAVDQLGIKLTALSSNKEADMLNAELFKKCLKDLHASYPAAEASTLIGRTSLDEAMRLLKAEEGKSTIFALHTETHAMLLGATNRGGSTSYHFYDPNFTLATFTSRNSLLNAAWKFFGLPEYGFADAYGAAKTSSDIFFTLAKLDTDEMARIRFDFNLSVADFCDPGTLIETVDAKAAMELYLPPISEFSRDPVLSAGADLLEAAGLAEAWREATARLEADNGLEGHWMPILQTLEDLEGGAYQVQFINLENTAETRWVSTEDPEIKNFKEYIAERLEASNKAYEFIGEAFVPKDDVPSAEAIDGLNAMLVVQTLIEYLCGRKDSDNDDRTNSNLAMALKVQSYLNLAQLGQQSLGDVVKIVELTKTIIRSEEAVQSSLSTLVGSLGRISEGLGFVFGIANIGLDAYELHNATSETEKAVYGTQLAFDSASFLASAGGAGAGMIGASSAAAILGGVGVILGGLAIGIGALAAAFGQIAENAQAVGKYFGNADNAYSVGGYKYDKEHNILIPLTGAVITEIKATGEVKFDSQWIYRTHHGITGSGRIKYFFWAGDFPVMDQDKNQAINVRTGINAPSSGKLPKDTHYTILILPATPKSYIRYEYAALPFCTTRHDYGFDIIRKLEADEKFDYDFYIFPSEYTICHISHDYVKTPVAVYLETRTMRVQVPQLPKNMHNVLEYTLHGAGADYTVGLCEGVGMTLSSNNKDTRWILDCNDLGDGTITVEGDGVSIAGSRVTIVDRKFSSMLIIKANGEVGQVDFDRRKFFAVKEDASKFSGSTEKLLAHLDDLNREHLLTGRFIIVENYVTPRDNKVGRAFYDVAKERLLYTIDAPKELTESVQFGADMGAAGVCFYNTEHCAIWRVDPDTGTCLATYVPLYLSYAVTLMRVWEEGGQVHAVYRHKLSEGLIGELCYILTADSMNLVSVVAWPGEIRRLHAMDRWEGPPELLVKSYAHPNAVAPPSFTKPLPGLARLGSTTLIHGPLCRVVDPSLGPGVAIRAGISPYIVSVFGHEYDGTPAHFWIRFTDRAIIKPNYCPQPDLVLAGIITLPVSNVEEFYFYSREAQQLVAQTGTGLRTSQPVDAVVPPQFGKLSNVFCANNEMFAITDAGYFLRLTSQGTFLLEAVNKQWFAQIKPDKRKPWWDILKGIAESYGATTVAILDLHDPYDNIVPAWLCSGRIVVSSPGISTQLHIAGLNENGQEAWLCHLENLENPENNQLGRLYSQPVVPDEQLETIFSPTEPLVISNNIPWHKKVLEGNPFKKVAKVKNGLRYTTWDGVILMITKEDTITLYGVDTSWQSEHRDYLKPCLDDLAKEWNHGEVILLTGSKPDTAPSWYLISAGEILVVEDPSITWLDGPVWLGTDISGTGGYFYLSSRAKICSVGIPEAAINQGVTLAARLGDLLVVGPARGQGFRSIALKDVRKIMISGGNGKGYLITPSSWASYDMHIIEWKMSCRVELELLQRSGAEVGSFLAKKVNDDLVIFDAYTCRALVIRKVFEAGLARANVSVKCDEQGFHFLIKDVKA